MKIIYAAVISIMSFSLLSFPRFCLLISIYISQFRTLAIYRISRDQQPCNNNNTKTTTTIMIIIIVTMIALKVVRFESCFSKFLNTLRVILSTERGGHLFLYPSVIGNDNNDNDNNSNNNIVYFIWHSVSTTVCRQLKIDTSLSLEYLMNLYYN